MKQYIQAAVRIVSRFMGLILVAMGMQFALEGYKAFMAGG